MPTLQIALSSFPSLPLSQNKRCRLKEMLYARPKNMLFFIFIYLIIWKELTITYSFYYFLFFLRAKTCGR